MATQTKFSLLLLFTFSLFLGSQCYHTEDLMGLQKCQMKCFEEEDDGSRHQILCLTECRRGYAGEEPGNEANRLDPRKEFEWCMRECRKYDEKEQKELKQYCKDQCRERYEGQGGNHHVSRKEEEEQGENNPYFFEGQRFKTRYRTEAGEYKILERFGKRSKLLKGIDNYRLATLEADPNTFILPHHCDSDAVFFVNRGEGTVTFVHHEGRESFNLERGDAINVPAGSTVYLINRHNNERLQVLMFVNPINIPGHPEGFFGAGGQEPQSFYRVFSNELLEAAFNTPREKLERVFGQQRKGVVVRARPEQIRALSQHAEGSSRRRGQSRGPFNLFRKPPSFCNNYGKFSQFSPEDNDQLKDLDLSVALMNINQGAMVTPYYNSKSTILVFVAKGTGYYEMACPHLASPSQRGPGEQEQRGIHYQKVSAQFSDGDAFIIPADHPISIVSSGNQDLQLVGFGINAQNNHKYFLAGQENIWNKVESEAKELSFSVPSREVDQVLRSQELSYFVPVPGQQQQRGEQGRGIPMPSILDFVGFL